MSDLYQQVSDDQDVFRKLAGKIPGFSGYVERENRRAADKLLRESIVDKYMEIWKKVGEMQKDLADKQDFEYLDDLDGAATKLRTFVDKVRTASYGETGFFDAVKIKSPELQRLYEFDLALVNKADDLSKAVDNVKAAMGGEEMAAPVDQLVTLSRDLVTTFDQRSEVITAQ